MVYGVQMNLMLICGSLLMVMLITLLVSDNLMMYLYVHNRWIRRCYQSQIMLF